MSSTGENTVADTHHDHETKAKIFEELENVESVAPGANGHVSGNALLVATDGHIRKVPTPSSNPNDPLNFLPWQKYGVIFSCCWFSIMSLALSGGLGSILAIFFELYIPQGHSQADVVRLLTLPSLFIGIGNFVILPFMLWAGRRPTFLGCNVILLIATIGAAVNNSYEGHLTARLFQSLATGTIESLLPLILSEVTFIHERATIYGWYWATQTILSSVLNIAASYETAALSWRWYYGIFAVTVGVGLIIAFFLAFETRFRREATALDGQFVYQDEFGATRILSEEEAQAHLTELEAVQTNSAPVPRKKYVELLSVWPGGTPNAGRIIIRAYWSMLEACLSPGLLFALLSSTMALTCLIGLSQTYNIVLLKNYGWSAESIGLMNIGPIPASLAAMVFAGYFGDRFTLWMAKRNNGVHTPEHRLPLLIAAGIFGIVGILLYGYTADNVGHKYHWMAPVMGWCLYYFSFVSVIILSTTFAAEAWPNNPGPALIFVVGTKNLIAFGITYDLTHVFADWGYVRSHGMLAGILGGTMLLGIPVYYFNPRWRKYTSKKEADRKAKAAAVNVA